MADNKASSSKSELRGNIGSARQQSLEPLEPLGLRRLKGDEMDREDGMLKVGSTHNST